ncbi:unnamed protein product [Paramecium pentaurelia]|uniref:Uncharacterized protein n=1 Tax=Paramecium pentaurelia TaxID=43138 RepID=A0A8S1WEV7_9CILI|nr:unnamed protein product [Paramecium pentaurelia]
MYSCISINSKDSIEEFLSLYHCKDSHQKVLLKKEREIVKYLKSLGLQMKTDPLMKFQQKNNLILQSDNSFDKEIVLEKKEFEDDDDIDDNNEELQINNNPLFRKRTSKKLIRVFSFEKNDNNSFDQEQQNSSLQLT